jgi:hypothetical protein
VARRHIYPVPRLVNSGVESCDAVSKASRSANAGFHDPIAVGAVTLPFINVAYWLAAIQMVKRGPQLEATDVP